MTITIEDKAFIKELQLLHADVETHQHVLSDLLSNGNYINNSSVTIYNNELRDLTIQYEQKKEDLENLFLKPVMKDKPFNWSLNYRTCEVAITEI